VDKDFSLSSFLYEYKIQILFFLKNKKIEKKQKKQKKQKKNEKLKNGPQ